MQGEENRLSVSNAAQLHFQQMIEDRQEDDQGRKPFFLKCGHILELKIHQDPKKCYGKK